MPPLRHLALFFLFSFAVLALATGYWSLIDRERLIARLDNPRNLLAFNRIQRGRILDRDGAVLAESVGQPGDYTRLYAELSAAHVIGYASFRYGLSGIEAAADTTLRGEEGLSAFEKWWRFDLLREPQVGHDVKLTLDLNLQRAASDALAQTTRLGAIVIVDTKTGDVLAMTSSPSFDPAKLDVEFETFNSAANGPLINRATLGLYSMGALRDLFPAAIDLTQPPALPIPTRADANGEQISPLQMALLAAAIPEDGNMPAPRLIAAKQSPTLEWNEQPPEGHPVAVMPPDAAAQLRNTFAANAEFFSLPMPGYTDTAQANNHTVGWFVGYTRDGSFTVCVLVEEATGADAARAAALIFESR